MTDELQPEDPGMPEWGLRGAFPLVAIDYANEIPALTSYVCFMRRVKEYFTLDYVSPPHYVRGRWGQPATGRTIHLKPFERTPTMRLYRFSSKTCQRELKRLGIKLPWPWTSERPAV